MTFLTVMFFKRIKKRWPPETVTLPSVVSVRYLIEVSGQGQDAVMGILKRLNVLVEPNRAVSFGIARKVLGRFGIRAESNGTWIGQR